MRKIEKMTLHEYFLVEEERKNFMYILLLVRKKYMNNSPRK